MERRFKVLRQVLISGPRAIFFYLGLKAEVGRSSGAASTGLQFAEAPERSRPAAQIRRAAAAEADRYIELEVMEELSL